MRVSKNSSSSRHRSSNSASSRFFKFAVLYALAYSFGLYSRRDYSNNNVLIDDALISKSTASNNRVRDDGQARSGKTVVSTPSSASTRPQNKATSRLFQVKRKQFSTPDALNLIPNDQLQLLDYFSDSFLLNKENFLKVPLWQIGIVEDACFAAIGKRSIHAHSKMFVDWTEFMVMHLSKWWNELGILVDEDSTMFDHTIQNIFGGYLKKMLSNQSPERSTKSPLHPTIAMIAFAPYKSRRDVRRGELLTAHAMASTIASLYQVGFGRVIVTCNGEEEENRAREAFRLVHLYATKDGNIIDTERIFSDQDIPTQIGNTELAAVKILNQTWFTTKWVKYNMPRAAVKGMQDALGGKFEDPSETKYWLGTTHDESYWKYVYLTEPDTLLHTKEQMWKPLREGLDQGLSFFPHRLQPLPHEINLPPLASADPFNLPKFANDQGKKHVSTGYNSKYLPNNVPPFSNVTNLEEDWHCCDGGSDWPGRSEEFGTKQQPCGSWWWSCGYRARKAVVEQSKEDVLENHKRLVPYPLMTIAKGTGVVFGPTEMGRRCFPSRTPCPKSN